MGRVSKLRAGFLQRRDPRLLKFHRVLLAACGTRAYREALRSAGVTSPRSVSRLRSIEELLRKLPCQTHEQFRAAQQEFDVPSVPPAPRTFRCPIPNSVRAAVVAANFEESAPVRVFPSDRVAEIRRFDPDVIAAPVETLLEWARAPRSESAMPSAHRAIVVFTEWESGALPESTRDFLWHNFQVPVFEQWLGSDGSVLAWECEAHDGFHVDEQSLVVEQSSNRSLILTSLTDCRRPLIRLVAEFTGTLANDPCGCGQPGLRLCGVSAS